MDKRYFSDFGLWARECVQIYDKGTGAPVPFVLNAPQRMLLSAMEEQRTRGLPVRIILLKSRQWGGSTHCHLLIYLEYIEPQPITPNVKNFKQKEPMDCPISSFSIS